MVVAAVACAVPTATLGATRATWDYGCHLILRIEISGVVAHGRKGRRHHLGWDNSGSARGCSPGSSSSSSTRNYHRGGSGHLVSHAIGDGGDGDSSVYLWDPRLNYVLPWLSNYMCRSSNGCIVQEQISTHLQMHQDTARSWESCRDTLSKLFPFSSSGSV